MIIKNANKFREDGTFEIGDISIKEDRIVTTCDLNDVMLEATGCYAIPGLIDIHFHGCAGFDFCDGTQEAFAAIANYELKSGITAMCPATMTLSEDRLANICKQAAQYQRRVGADLAGIHLEGPFLSVKKKGAQNEMYLQKPDLAMFTRLDELSNGLIKIISLAPEEEGAMDFIAALKGKKILSLAHTTANYDTAMEAFHNGANHVTHLYNAMLPLNHREPGVIGAAFDTPECSVELICDGIHIHPSVVRATMQLFGEDRVIFVSDSMRATGLPEGTYSLGGQEVQVKGKKATLTDGTIAGSVTNLMDCMKNAVLNMGIPLASAVKAAAVNPAKEIGIYKDYGSITPGKFANIVLLDQSLNVKKVIQKGKEIDLSSEWFGDFNRCSR